jgi:hypothetical protein
MFPFFFFYSCFHTLVLNLWENVKWKDTNCVKKFAMNQWTGGGQEDGKTCHRPLHKMLKQLEM